MYMSYTLASVHGQLCVWSCVAHSHIVVRFLFQSYCKTKAASHRVGRIIKVKKTAFWVVSRVILWFWPIFKCYSNHITPVIAPSLCYLYRNLPQILHYNFSLSHFALSSLHWSLLISLNSRLMHKLLISLHLIHLYLPLTIWGHDAKWRNLIGSLCWQSPSWLSYPYLRNAFGLLIFCLLLVLWVRLSNQGDFWALWSRID